MNCVPACYKDMVQQNDKLKKFYPNSFEVDANMEVKSFKAVPVLPFIDENIVLEATENLQEKLTEEEASRNSFGNELIMFRTDTPDISVFKKYKQIFDAKSPKIAKLKLQMKIDMAHYFMNESKGVSGLLYRLSPKHVHHADIPKLKAHVKSPLPEFLEDIPDNKVLTAVYYLPPFKVTNFKTIPKTADELNTEEMQDVTVAETPGRQKPKTRPNNKKRKREAMRAGKPSSAEPKAKRQRQ